MAPPNPKRPPRPPRPPGTQAPKDSDVELPFDDDEVDPLRADDPRPQRVPQFPAGSRRSRRQGGEAGSSDRELAPRFDWTHEYSDPGYAPAFLYVERGPGTGQLVPVKQGGLVMGRSSSADLRLQHPSISRRHAQLTRRGDGFFLKDLSSQNGTFVNRNRLTAEVEVMPGDEIAMGNALLRLRGPGGTPALGIPAVTATNTVPDGGRKRTLGTLGVALLAAALGSAVAALITVIAVSLSGEDAPRPKTPPTPSAPVKQLATEGTGSASPSAGAEAPNGTGPASARGEQAPVVGGEAPRNAGPAGEKPAVPAASESSGASSGARGPESRNEAGPAGSDATGAPRAQEASTGPDAASIVRGQEALTSPGAANVARGPEASTAPGAANAVRGPEAPANLSATNVVSGHAPSAGPSATDVAMGLAGTVAAKQEPGTASPAAPDVTAGSAKGRTPAEADVLKRYEAGDVAEARERAKAAKLTDLYKQLARFEYAESDSRKAQSKRDLPRAITQLTTAVSVDEALSQGGSKHGARLRQRLADLHVQAGTAHAKAGRTDEARTSFEQALKYAPAHREAGERLGRLKPAAAP